MARVIQGDDSMFNAVVTGEQHPANYQYLQSFIEAPSHHLNQAAQAFRNYVDDGFRKIEQSRSVRVIQAAKRALGSIFQSNEIRCLSTIGEMQYAPTAMQKYIMAEPEIRQSYWDQTLEGYSGTYQDQHPGDIGENHYHYRRVNNGLLALVEESRQKQNNKEPEWSATTYYDDLEPDDRELDILEQVDIVDTWENIRSKIREGKDDPTSRFNASL